MWTKILEIFFFIPHWWSGSLVNVDINSAYKWMCIFQVIWILFGIFTFIMSEVQNNRNGKDTHWSIWVILFILSIINIMQTIIVGISIFLICLLCSFCKYIIGFLKETKTIKNNKGSKDDMFSKKDREIIDLKKKLGKLEIDMEVTNGEKNKYYKECVDNEDHKFVKENIELKHKLTDQENSISRLENQIDVLNQKIDYMTKFNAELQSFPNVKKTIDSLSALTFTGLDEMERFSKLFKTDSAKEILDKLTQLVDKKN